MREHIFRHDYACTQVLCHEGDEATSMFVILSGIADVFIAGRHVGPFAFMCAANMLECMCHT
jgi:hypothetical protein